jgi:hypothetical protein
MSTNATDSETHADSAPSTLERLTALLSQLDSSWRAWEAEQAEYGKLQRRAEAMTRSRDIVVQNLTTTETARASAGVQLHNLEVEAETVEEKWRELSEHQQVRLSIPKSNASNALKTCSAESIATPRRFDRTNASDVCI